VTNIHKLIVTHFHPNEIAEAKKCLVAEFDDVLLDCPFRVTRRHSQARSAHDAEVEDILAIFDVLDNRDILKEVCYAAAQLDRLPKYGPTEINLCHIADNQSRLENDFQCMTVVIDDLKSEVRQSACGNAVHELVAQTRQLHTDIKTLGDTCSLLSQEIQAAHAAESISTQSAAQFAQPRPSSFQPQHTSRSPKTVFYKKIDRSRNVVVSGIAESANANDWSPLVTKALTLAAGRAVDFDDAFRLGKFADGRTRPILVKLRTPWDRRLTVSGAWKLHSDPELSKVFIRVDEPLDDRRHSTLQRLKRRAEHQNKLTDVTDDGILHIDGVPVFSISNGFVRVHDNNVTNDA
jgi:hypothetical protein